MSAGVSEEFGPYTIFEELGVGGMASVHRAETRGLAGFTRSVALKRMLPQCAVSSDFVQSFVREARIASHLRHINVAQTYELGKVDGIYFIAMELVAGKNLRQVLRHCAQMSGPMPVAVTLNVLNQICDALDYAHNLCDETGQPLGIIHRDVSPSNIIVSEDGVVKLIDFGIAKASAAGMQTTSGMLKGKFGYMAPEYIAGSIDARADLWAVGVIAHELLTNRPLFTARDDMETLVRVRDMDIKPPSARNRKIPPEIDDIVMTALARDPERRWQQATALRTALTTMTRRLGLVCENGELAEWLEWAFRQDRPTTVDIGDDDTTGVHGTDGATATPTTVEPAVAPNDLRRTSKQERLLTPARGSQPPGDLVAPPRQVSSPRIQVLAQPSPNPAILAPAIVKMPRSQSVPPPMHAAVEARPLPVPLVRPTPVPPARAAPPARSNAALVVVTLLVLVAAAAVVVYFVALS